MHPLKICHFSVQATHVHIIAVVENPDDVPRFLRYFKTESAHMLNRILGRRKRTIWCAGYDSPIVLTPVRALTAIAYIYSNPAKDNLVDSIDEFPGLSSWHMFRSGEHSRWWKRLRRPAFKQLAPDSYNLRGYTKEADRLLKEKSKSFEFVLKPNAWLEAFKISDPEEQKRLNDRIAIRVKTLEERAKEKRSHHNKSVIGKDRLRNQSLDLYYRPSRTGRRMCCLTEDRATRIAFISFIKSLYDKARAVAARWKLGDFSVPFPPGLYPPSMPKLIEPLHIW